MSNLKNRCLAAILFADIQGYTATMQTDESEALNNLKKFKSSLETEVSNHQGTRRILRPVSDKLFTTLLVYEWNYSFVEKEGRIVGIQGHRYNHETKEWQEQDNWYFERKAFLG